VQGIINGKNFLVTCPIDIYAEVSISFNNRPSNAGNKTIQAVQTTWAYLGFKPDFYCVTSNTALPQGKGMASSSADISAACQAAAICANRQLSVNEIAEIALSIEPTDGIFFPGIVMFDHLKGLSCIGLGSPPPMKVAIFDVGGEVDTLQFNKRSDLVRLNREKEEQVRQALVLVTEGLAEGDCRKIGRGATLSAVANQRILRKDCVNKLLALIPQIGAVGINAAHSGTVIGILFDAAGDWANATIERCVAAVQNICPELNFLQVANIVSGGLSSVEEK
jgi:L-threonine kinase